MSTINLNIPLEFSLDLLVKKFQSSLKYDYKGELKIWLFPRPLLYEDIKLDILLQFREGKKDSFLFLESCYTPHELTFNNKLEFSNVSLETLLTEQQKEIRDIAKLALGKSPIVLHLERRFFSSEEQLSEEKAKHNIKTIVSYSPTFSKENYFSFFKELQNLNLNELPFECILRSNELTLSLNSIGMKKYFERFYDKATFSSLISDWNLNKELYLDETNLEKDLLKFKESILFLEENAKLIEKIYKKIHKRGMNFSFFDCFFENKTRELLIIFNRARIIIDCKKETLQNDLENLEKLVTSEGFDKNDYT